MGSWVKINLFLKCEIKSIYIQVKERKLEMSCVSFPKCMGDKGSSSQESKKFTEYSFVAFQFIFTSHY